ncbi:MAG: hypothetical protein AAGI49_14500 [Bacteroidota bacterium]
MKKSLLSLIMLSLLVGLYSSLRAEPVHVIDANAVNTVERTTLDDRSAINTMSKKQARKALKQERKLQRLKKRVAKWQARAEDDSQTAAIIAYITLIGFLISLLALHEEGDEFSAFHLRQSLGIFVVAVALGIIGIIPIVGWIVAAIGSILLLIAWIIGLVGAINGSTKPVFLLGEQFQSWFSGID